VGFNLGLRSRCSLQPRLSHHGLSNLRDSYFDRVLFPWDYPFVSAQEIIEQIKHLPPAERAQVAKFVVENDDSWIPEELREAMKGAQEGRLVDMETALFETPPPHLR
jgi:hypothetical protein